MHIGNIITEAKKSIKRVLEGDLSFFTSFLTRVSSFHRENRLKWGDVSIMIGIHFLLVLPLLCLLDDHSLTIIIFPSSLTLPSSFFLIYENRVSIHLPISHYNPIKYEISVCISFLFSPLHHHQQWREHYTSSSSVKARGKDVANARCVHTKN